MGKEMISDGPAAFKILTKLPSSVYGFPVLHEYPTLTSNPFTAIESFSETGIPANGPSKLTSCSAQLSASGIITSVRQFVFSCAFIATFP